MGAAGFEPAGSGVAAGAGANFVAAATGRANPRSTARCSGEVRCKYYGFHSITSSYDRKTRTLIFFRRCNDCGARSTDVRRLVYEPRFDPGGTERFPPIARPPVVEATPER